jgi:hypothetical protein
MATGDAPDILTRLKAVLPDSWFPDATPVLDAVLTGCATGWAFCYGLLAYVRLQTRIATATDVFLDIAATDYFGGWLSRFVNEGDPAFSLRIRANLLPERGTRAGLIAAVTTLTGSVPTVFEPADTGDTGGYGGGQARVWTGMAYGAAGGWGSLALPFQAFVTAARQHGGGVAGVNGYGGYLSGWGVGSGEYISASMIAGRVPDAAIFQVVSDAGPAGSVMWTRLTALSYPSPPSLRFNLRGNSGLRMMGWN